MAMAVSGAGSAPEGRSGVPRPPHCEDRVVDCRLRAALDLFAHVWDPLVLAALDGGPLRRSAVKAAVGGVQDKPLTEALHRLQGNGLLSRRRYRESPPRVEYAVTPLGRTLLDGPMRAMAEWTAAHADTLLAAQAAAEGRAAAAGSGAR